MPPPVDITVSQLRDALWEVAPHEADSRGGPGALAGRIFHETVSGLIRGERSWQTVLNSEELDKAEVLRRHAYEWFVGPSLTRYEAALQEGGREALWLWKAVHEACRWLSGILVAARERGLISFDPQADQWRDSGLIAPEVAIERDFHRSGWSATVRIHGVADAVVCDPRTGCWCVVEFKLGDGGGAIDLCQAALYHALLEAQKPEGDLALVRFMPEREERIITAAQLKEARERLIDLAGCVAGVTSGVAPAPPRAVARGQYAGLGNQILQVLERFHTSAALTGAPVVGPSFVRFMLKPGPSVSVRKILNASDDLGVQLGIPSPWLDLEDGVLVLDVPRGDDREVVPFARIREHLRKVDPLQGTAEIPIGIDLNGRIRTVDLSASESPHVLVAGTAGSGKSEWLRSAIASLILTNTPDTLRLVLIDPKRMAFGDLAGSAYLLDEHSLVFPPDGSMRERLDRLIEEMESRYRQFHEERVDHLSAWRIRTRSPMPRIVCVVDEFADVMADSRERREVEDRVVRLGAKARAAGIHLILSTQHPDAKTVTGRLQANLSVRVCLRTATWQQSMVALKRRGAERLLGKGDLFFSRGDRMWRLQAPFLPEDERREIFGGVHRVAPHNVSK
jgi:S-DNA-T family DNA segregation ATPase FtsK/SpoIIIE